VDGILPVADAGKELIGQGILGILLLLALWYIGRKDQDLKDERSAHATAMAEKDKLIQSLQESRVSETRTLTEVVGEINAALLANKTGIESLMPLLRELLAARH
jgi:hypothetical protein